MSVAKILISACLLGQPVRYDGRGNTCSHDALETWRRQGRLVPICPELAGGLEVPRAPAEILGGSGADVLDGRARVIDIDGHDRSASFCAGARATLELALAQEARYAILKARSPSCGARAIYDGSFSKRLREGQGVTAALLTRHGIAVFHEDELDRAWDVVTREDDER